MSPADVPEAECGYVPESYEDTHSYARNASSCVGGELE